MSVSPRLTARRLEAQTLLIVSEEHLRRQAGLHRCLGGSGILPRARLDYHSQKNIVYGLAGHAGAGRASRSAMAPSSTAGTSRSEP